MLNKALSGKVVGSLTSLETQSNALRSVQKIYLQEDLTLSQVFKSFIIKALRI